MTLTPRENNFFVIHQDDISRILELYEFLSNSKILDKRKLIMDYSPIILRLVQEYLIDKGNKVIPQELNSNGSLFWDYDYVELPLQKVLFVLGKNHIDVIKIATEASFKLLNEGYYHNLLIEFSNFSNIAKEYIVVEIDKWAKAGILWNKIIEEFIRKD